MGSPLSPVLSDMFMEEFETSSLRTADLQPSLWLRYVGDTFVVWPRGRDELQNFIQHLKFTMEVEEDGKISFLDVGISRNPESSLHHNVYRKPTHADRYRNQRSCTTLASSHRSTTPSYNAPTTYATRIVYPRKYGTPRQPSSATATNPARLTHRSLSQTLITGYPIPKV